MKDLASLGISPAPWKSSPMGMVRANDTETRPEYVCGRAREADARLIAAAPTMYQTLLEAYNYLSRRQQPEMHEQIRKALALAGGEEASK